MPSLHPAPRRLLTSAVLGTTVAVALMLAGAGSAVATCGSTTIAAGTGVAGDPYQVTTRADLEQIGASAANMACEYKLMNDIALGGIGSPWTPLGPGSPTTTFTGKLLGNNKTISGLAFSTGADIVGLFRELGGATISDLTLSSVNVTGHALVGAIAGQVSAGTNTFTDITVSGAVTASIPSMTYADAGGLVGKVETGATLSIARAAASTTVTGTMACVGGMVGENAGTLQVTDARAIVTATSGDSAVGAVLGFAPSSGVTTINGLTLAANLGPATNVGGAIGFAYGATTVSNVGGAVSITNSSNAGGVMGTTYSGGGAVSISGVDLSVNITAAGYGGRAGGIIGYSNNAALTLTDAAVSGSVTSTGGGEGAGGAIGALTLQSFASPATSIQRITNRSMTISTDAAYAGGIVGKVTGAQTAAQLRDLKVQGGTVQASYGAGGVVGSWQVGFTFSQVMNASRWVSHADVTATNGDAGGLIGRVHQGSNNTLTVVDSYADHSVTSGASGSAGGLVGQNATTSSTPVINITSNYAAPTISATSKGALTGLEVRGSGTRNFANSLWSASLSGASTARAGALGDDGSLPQTAADMASITPYDSAGWSIRAGWQPVATRTKTWGICGLVNGGQPFLLIEFDSEPCLVAPPSPVATPGNTTATITWGAQPTGAVSVTNYEYQIDGGVWTAVSPASDATTITLGDLTNGTSYSVRLRAVGPNGPGDEGPASAAVLVSPAAPVIPAPDASASPADAQTSEPSSGSPARPLGRLTVVSPPTEAWIEAGGADAAHAPDALRTRVRVTGPGTIRQQATATGTAELARAAGAGRWSVCSDTTPVRVAGVVTITCRLSTRARAALQARALRTRVTTTFIGTDGTRSRAVRTVTLARVVPRRGARTAVTG